MTRQGDEEHFEGMIVHEEFLALKREADELRAALKLVPTNVRRLVIAARKVAFEDRSPAAIKELDSASEAFADCVPWEDEPQRSGEGTPMTEIPESNYRRCSRCNKTFASRAGADQHIATVHKGVGKRVPVMTKDHPDHPEHEPSEWERIAKLG